MEFGYITKFHGIAITSWEVPWNSMEFLKFHGIWLCNQIPWTSMEFHGLRIPRWIPWNYGSSIERGVTWNSMEFHGTLGPLNGLSPSSIEFHGIPWNSGAAKWNITKFHGIPWNFEIVILINTMLSWASMGYTMEFRGTLESPKKITEFHGIPWN